LTIPEKMHQKSQPQSSKKEKDSKKKSTNFKLNFIKFNTKIPQLTLRMNLSKKRRNSKISKENFLLLEPKSFKPSNSKSLPLSPISSPLFPNLRNTSTNLIT